VAKKLSKEHEEIINSSVPHLYFRV